MRASAEIDALIATAKRHKQPETGSGFDPAADPFDRGPPDRVMELFGQMNTALVVDTS